MRSKLPIWGRKLRFGENRSVVVITGWLESCQFVKMNDVYGAKLRLRLCSSFISDSLLEQRI